MKRFFSLALVLALASATCMPAALAESADAVSEAVEAEVAEAEVAGDTGLTVEGMEEAPAIEPAVPEEAPAAEPTEPEEAPATGLEAEAEAPAEEAPQTEAAEAPVEDMGEQAVAAPAAAGPATGIQFSAGAVTLGVKETCTLAITAVPAGSALPAVSWRSDNEKFVKVDGSGQITAVKKGEATVYAKMEGGQEVPCKVTVLKAPSKLIMSSKKLTLGGDGQTAQLSYNVPKGCCSNTFTWSSSNPKVATVDQNGRVTTVGAGKAVIMVKAFNGKGGKCKVTVLGAPTAIAFPTAELSIAVDQKMKLAPVVTFAQKKKNAEAAIAFAISPNSRDAGCVSLNPYTGEIVGVRKGSAIITATTYNGKTATLPVTVAAAPTAIELNESAVVIGVKDVYSGLLATLTVPAGETECASTLAWTSSNKKVAKVDENGIITGLKKGTTVITATTVNGKQASCKVTVWKAPKKIAINPTSASLQVGETGQYKIAFPKNSGGTVRFDTSDHSVATIDDDGVVTAVALGTVTITATTFNGKQASAKLSISAADAALPENEYESITSETAQYSADMTNAQKLEYVIYVAQSQLGKPYIYGSGYKKVESPSGFDCSGLVYWSFLHIDLKLKDTAYKQGYDDSQTKITTASGLKRGDVVCFNTVDDGNDDLCDHTGIYLGNGKFIHASSSAKKVVISTLASGYYSRTFSWGRRVLP